MMKESQYGNLIIQDLKGEIFGHMFEGIKVESDKLGEPFSILYSIVKEPKTMAPNPHVHEFPQYWFFWGANGKDVFDFDAEIEFHLGDELHRINRPSIVHIPSGVVHCPLRFTRVGKPIGYLEMNYAASYTVKDL